MRRLECANAPGSPLPSLRATEKSALVILQELEEEVVEQLVVLNRSVGRRDYFLVKERLFQLADALKGARTSISRIHRFAR